MRTRELRCSTSRRSSFLLAFFSMILWTAGAAAVEKAQISRSKVVYLTDATFQDYNDGFLLVLYYANWSGQSRRMFPIWSQLAEEIDSAGLSVTVGMIDSQEYRQSPGSSYVRTLPTLFLFHNEEILAHLVKESTVEDLKSSVKKLIDLSSEELANYKKLAKEQLEEEKLEREENAKDMEMQETLLSLKFESDVPTLQRENFFPDTSDKYALIMVYTTWCEHCKAFKADWVALARDQQIPGLLVAKINLDSFSSFPGARLVTGVPTILFLKYSVVLGKYDGVRKLEDIRIWVNNMMHLSAEGTEDALANIREEQLEIVRNTRQKFADNNEQSNSVNEDFMKVKELRDDNFAAETQGKSVLILFYTERGQRSQLMKPVWVALSKRQDLDELLLARFPEQDNRWSQEIEFIHGYPTVLFARNGLIIERYEGVQKLDELHHYAQSLLELSDEEAHSKHGNLIRTMEREKMEEVEQERLLAKAEEKRREEEIRKAKQLKRKLKSRYG